MFSKKFMCLLLGHFPDFAKPFRANNGADFGTCFRCERGIYKWLDRDWELPPRGMRIVWRPRAPKVTQDLFALNERTEHAEIAAVA